MAWNNDEIGNSIIINRRPARDNEFIFDYNSPLVNVNRMFKYIERISNISIEEIPREELPTNQGLNGWRVIKK